MGASARCYGFHGLARYAVAWRCEGRVGSRPAGSSPRSPVYAIITVYKGVLHASNSRRSCDIMPLLFCDGYVENAHRNMTKKLGDVVMGWVINAWLF